jgi:dTDP-4-dehydrorhamnose reductase
MKLFLTGASGLVGSNVARVAARRGHEVIGVTGTWTGAIPGATRTLALNLAREADVQRAVLDEFPDAIVNCAAMSSPASCVRAPVQAAALNVDLPATLAKLAHHLGARLVHLSSEQVFDGKTNTPYRATDPVNPPNLYGQQKVQSEGIVGEFAPDNSVVVRLPLLGGNSLTGRRSFHERFFADWAAGRKTRLYRDEFRQPCSAENVAEVLVELIERRDPRGVVHWAGAVPVNRVTLGRAVARQFRLPDDIAGIDEANRADDPGGAERQAWLALDCSPLAGLLKTRPESLEAMMEKLVVPPSCRAWYAGLPGS